VTEPLVILGGGASGLSMSLLTSAPLMERAPHAGGHAVSTVADGFTFDRGPHIIFSRSSLLLDSMVGSLGANVHQCVRNNKVAVGGALVKYPIENDLASLPVDMRTDCLVSYVETRLAETATPTDPGSLAEWFRVEFGDVLTELYFRPYNEKVWKVPLEELSMVWSERIPRPPVADVVRSAVGQATEGYLHQLHYHYPLAGGYSALMDSWARGVEPRNLELDCAVTAIRPVDDGLVIETSQGTRHCERAVCTLPIYSLPTLIENVPQQIVDAIARLRTNATVIVTLGFAGIDPNQWTAVYIPDTDFLPNRISYPAVFSPRNAPDGHFSVQAEVIVPTLRDVEHLGDDHFTEHVLSGLRSRGLIPADAELVGAWVERFELAYVVYTQGFEADLQLAMDWAESVGLLLHGRFGSHNYLNVDGCLEQSIGLARRLGHSLSDEDVLTTFTALGGAS